MQNPHPPSKATIGVRLLTAHHRGELLALIAGNELHVLGKVPLLHRYGLDFIRAHIAKSNRKLRRFVERFHQRTEAIIDLDHSPCSVKTTLCPLHVLTQLIRRSLSRQHERFVGFLPSACHGRITGNGLRCASNEQHGCQSQHHRRRENAHPATVEPPEAMGHTGEVQRESGVLRPGIRTYKPRRSRITPRQQRALQQPGPHLLRPDQLATAWQLGQPVILDIGFGSAEPVVALATAFPDTTIVAVDVHTPGIGDLIDRVDAENLVNVFVVETDAVELLSTLPQPAAGIRSFFPDPWPKARHHKRRLVQPAIIDAAYDALTPGGFWHVATDWAEYAESIQDAFAADDRWTGGVITRPAWRPVTHFEKRAIREGRDIVDMWFERN